MLLDGFDEIDFDKRNAVQRQLITLHERHREMTMIISSRSDDRFSSWIRFNLFKVLPMRKSDALKLISRLNYDGLLRQKFYQRVKKDLFATHESFLSNPLLITIMMITYHQFAEIPDKIHLFYEHAFEALFFRHDAFKEAAFRRKKNTSLAINEFKNVLSAFCIFSYTQQRFNFSKSEILDLIDEAKKYEGLTFDNEDYVADLIDAVCIMMMEGDLYVFTHRSFQEYFSAFFITRGSTLKTRELLDWGLERRFGDDVINMALSMAPALVEREWVAERLSLVLKYKSLSNLGFAIKVIGGIIIYKSGDQYFVAFSTQGVRFGRFFLTLPRLYPSQIKSLTETGHFAEDGIRNNFNHIEEFRSNGLISFSKEADLGILYKLKIADQELFAKLTLSNFIENLRSDAEALFSNIKKKRKEEESRLSFFLKEKHEK